MMKKFTLLFMLTCYLTTFTACSDAIAESSSEVPHTTTINYCQHGDNLYMQGHYYGIFNGALDTNVPLCFDPLCSHMEYNAVQKAWYSICPQNLAQHSLSTVKYTSDGKYIYMACKAENVNQKDTTKRSIYRFDPEYPSDMKLITTYSTTGAVCDTPIYVFDGMIYYQQGVYNDDFIKGGVETYDDQYMQMMCVKASGGEGQAALDGKFHVTNKLYMDDKNFYIVNYDGPLTIIDRKTNEKTEVQPDGLSPSTVYTIDGVQYFICEGEAEYITFETETYNSKISVYRYENGVCERICEGIEQAEIMDGALWYVPYELTYYGSREAFNGRGYEMYDYFSDNASELHRIDLATGEEKVWKNEDTDVDLDFVGVTAGYAIVRPSSPKKDYESDEKFYTPMYWKAELGDDGVIRLISGIEE